MHTVDHEPDQRAAETENDDKSILTGSYGVGAATLPLAEEELPPIGA
jgi:hypothetical protein